MRAPPTRNSITAPPPDGNHSGEYSHRSAFARCGAEVTHANQALLRMFHPEGFAEGQHVLRGARLADVFPQEVLEDLEPLLRRADRMGMTTSQMEMPLQRTSLNVAVTVATLRHQEERSGYVIVFEDLSDLLKAQKQAAWREVARRVAHEIKNPLTPIALSAERIQRHLERGTPPDQASLEIVRSCAETIAGAVETVRRLVDEFSTLARFPASNPQPADINEIIEERAFHVQRKAGRHRPSQIAGSRTCPK